MRLGTRGSALALVQARAVAAALGGDAEVVTITTSGDRGDAVGDKARWVDAIEAALLAGEIDLAVHSAKDVPGKLGDGLCLAAALAREDPRDALVGATSLEGLPQRARVGTSSLRRRAQLLAVRDDLEVVEVRGNVDTRLRKLVEGAVDALVLAAAGLRRLERQDAIGALLDPSVFVPAPGQGVIALEARAGDDAALDAAAHITHPETARCLEQERACVEALGASCHTPVGAHATARDGGILLTAFAGLPDGSEWMRDAVWRSDGEPLGAEVAARLEAVGGRELLRRAAA